MIHKLDIYIYFNGLRLNFVLCLSFSSPRNQWHGATVHMVIWSKWYKRQPTHTYAIATAYVVWSTNCSRAEHIHSLPHSLVLTRIARLRSKPSEIQYQNPSSVNPVQGERTSCESNKLRYLPWVTNGHIKEISKDNRRTHAWSGAFAAHAWIAIYFIIHTPTWSNTIINWRLFL